MIPYQPRALGRDPHVEDFLTTFSRTYEEHPVSDFVEKRVDAAIRASAVGTVLTAAASSPWRWVRFGAKGAIRLVPYVGWALLAYDLYELGDEMELY